MALNSAMEKAIVAPEGALFALSSAGQSALLPAKLAFSGKSVPEAVRSAVSAIRRRRITRTSDLAVPLIAD